MVSPLDGSSRTAQVTVPSSIVSCTPVTVTVSAVFQPDVVKVSDEGDTLPSPRSRLDTATVTAADGCVRSATANVAVPPASVAEPDTAPTARPYSLSRLRAYTVSAESPS